MIHHYKLNGYNIILDIASGSIHSVDDAAYDTIVMYESKSKDEIAKYLITTYKDVALMDALKILAKVEELKEEGKLFSQDDFKSKTAGIKNLPLKALCLNMSHKCNMSCEYCFITNNISNSNELMSLDVAKKAIDFLIVQSREQKYLDIDFFGGEPLLNLEVVKEVVAYARKLEPNYNKKFRFTLTTNGLFIDDDVISFTNREIHNVVLSLDGRQEVHDGKRKLPDGSGSYDEVLPKIKKLVEARRAKDYYIRGTYTSSNTDFVLDIFHLADLGFKELAIEPVVSKAGTSYALSNKDLPGLLDQYESLALEMLKRRDQGRGFNFYHYMLDLTEGPCLHKRITGCGVGIEYLAVTPKGELYPCHQFVGNEKFLMGDVFTGITNKIIQSEFRGCDIYSKSECAKCWARFYCSGGCAANAYYATGSIKGVNRLECELIKKRIECAIMLKVAEIV